MTRGQKKKKRKWKFGDIDWSFGKNESDVKEGSDRPGDTEESGYVGWSGRITK